MEAPINIDMNDDDVSQFANNPRKPKKRLKNEVEWKRNKAKLARLRGNEFRDENNEIIVRGRCMRNIVCTCGCDQLLSDCDKEYIFEQFNAKQNHTLQNEYLRGCIEVTNCVTLSNGTIRRVFVHKLHFEKTVTVCQKFFLAIHGIDRSRLRRKVLKREVHIQDRRGLHPNHKRVTSIETKNLMRVFLSSLPARESHYSRNKNTERRFMESHWTISELCNTFFTYYPEIQRHDATLTIFREVFNTEFNIKFGFPRSDICDICSGFLNSIRILKRNFHENVDAIETTRNNHDRHLKLADVFYSDMSAAKTFVDTHFSMCMDYQQNMALPVTGINKEFYLRQLWAYNFGIKDLKSGLASMFLYSEHFAKKGRKVNCVHNNL
ncbi:unnamed protein product [Allacma fusca]|uniref:Uncharacterized protein n=1 Tax=Allacma fusca TaxID=39272 RepID=A0A8J2L661_9HEXA|nr:unnamed protein product [Allacma fusca]